MNNSLLYDKNNFINIDYNELMFEIYNVIKIYNEDGTVKLFNSGDFEKDYSEAFQYAMKQMNDKIINNSMSYIVKS